MADNRPAHRNRSFGWGAAILIIIVGILLAWWLWPSPALEPVTGPGPVTPPPVTD